MNTESIPLVRITNLARRRFRLLSSTIGLVAVALVSNQEGSSNGWIFYAEECGGKDAIEYGHSRMLEPCESDKVSIELEKRVGSLCTAEAEACRDDRMSRFGVSSEDAEEFLRIPTY